MTSKIINHPYLFLSDTDSTVSNKVMQIHDSAQPFLL